jgi:OmpA-OmpF porin, OOP family
MFMKKVLFAAALAAACGVASAQGYAGALIGLGQISTDCPVGLSCDDSSTAMKVYGGYEVAPNISVEVGYTNFGKAKLKGDLGSAEIKATALVLNGAFRFPIATDFTGVARLGIASMKGKYSDTLGDNKSKSSIKLYTGLGLEFDIAKDIKLVGAFDLSNADVESSTGSDSGTVFLIGGGVQAAF